MTDKLADALKPCPFCNAALEQQWDTCCMTSKEYSWWEHPKSDCYLSEIELTDEDDYSKWNTRPTTTPDDVREVFEAAYRTGDPLIDGESLSRDFDGVYEAALARLCFKWFGLGHTTALRQGVTLQRQVVDALKKTDDAIDTALTVFDAKQSPDTNKALVYIRKKLAEALSLLDQHARGG